MDKPQPGRREGLALGGDVGQPGAEGEDQVALGEGGALGGRVPEADVAGIEGVRVREQVLAAERDGVGSSQASRKAATRRGPRADLEPLPASTIGRRPPRSQGGEAGGSAGRRGPGRGGSPAWASRGTAGEDVLRQGDDDGPGDAVIAMGWPGG